MRFVTLLSMLLAAPLFGKTFTVVNTNDAGPGSLRQAITEVNDYPCSPSDRCTIEFAIDGPVPESGWFTIAPLSPLPVIERSPLTIDGTSQTRHTGETNLLGPEIELDGTHAGYRSGIKAFATYELVVQGLVVNRFEGHGIFVQSSSRASVRGNYVGVDPTGSIARPNGFNGIAFHRVQGGYRIEHNLVSGNTGNGIYAVASSDLTIRMNRIGVTRAGDAALPNGASGIDARGERIYVQENVIAHNALLGVGLSGNVELYGNAIFGNGVGSIASWEANAPEPPILISATESSESIGYYTGFPVVTGRVHSTPATTVVINAYATPRAGSAGAEARILIGQATVTTDSSGNATFVTERSYYESAVLDLFGGFVTATATPEGGPTSRFATPVALRVTTSQFEVTHSGDSGAGSLREAIAHVNASECTIDHACRIVFNIPVVELRDGAARIALTAPLPAIRGYVRLNGDSQSWWRGDTNPDGPEVEIRGGAGLVFGTAAEPVARAFVRGVVFNGSSADGLAIFATAEDVPQIAQPRIQVTEVYSGTDIRGTTPVPNAANGLRLEGGVVTAQMFRANARVRSSVFNGNLRHGILLGGDMHAIESNAIGLNQGHGIYVTGGTQHTIDGNSIAYNARDGVATAPGTRAPSVQSSIFRNGGLGIDVHDDGVKPADGNQGDGTIDPPVVQRAWYDATRDITFVEGVAIPESKPAFPGQGGAREEFATILFVSSEPDPSDYGEGEMPVPASYPPLAVVEGERGAFRIGVRGDLRGKWFTATTNRFYCYWEAGCQSRESSEFSNAVRAD